MDALRIDPEFKSLITELSADELAELEQSILAEGCRDALVVWNGVIVDGHNRYGICTKHNLPYRTTEREFADRSAVKEWIFRNQLARRNLSTYDRGRIALQLKSLIAARAKENQRAHSLSPNLGKVDTEKELASTAGVSHGTLHKIEAIERDAPEAIKQKARAGDMSTHRAYEMTKALKGAAADIVEAVARLSIDEPETVDVLRRLKKSYEHEGSNDTFGEILKSGFIQPGEEQEAVHIGEGPLRIQEALKLKSKIHRQLANDELRKNAPELPPGKYSVLVADPPWAYSNSGFDQSAEAHYPTMPIDDICAMPVRDRADDNAVLFLWATSPLLPDALAVMKAWGFEYKACMVWKKNRAPGAGWWLHTYHELLLIGERGNFKPVIRPASVIDAPVSDHSRKPEKFYEVITEMYPGAKRLELFAREDRPGWDVFGNEVPAYANA